MANYNNILLTITDPDGDSISFEMQSASISDPVSASVRYGQMVQTGLGDPVQVTGEANYDIALMRFLVKLSENKDFFVLTTRIKTFLNATEKRVYKRCAVEGSNLIASVNRGEEIVINIAFSCNDIESWEVEDV